MTGNPYSLYLHIPFCRHRCGYCDFNTYAGLDYLVSEYCRAVRRELQIIASSSGRNIPVHTIFFGGGTPSLLPVNEIEAILNQAARNFQIQEDVEISLEANPGTVSLSYLRSLRQAGVNRLSFGVQSANVFELRMLEREHSYVDVIEAVTNARRVGFDNLNLDLIFGLPHQSLVTWQHTVMLALGLQPEHFALYALTLEHGTPMQQWAARGILAEPDADLAADMYEWASDSLDAAGYSQYEISNWALSDAQGIHSCRHNLQYWRSLPYLGFGAGAHGYADGVRTANVLSPNAYIQRCLNGADRVFPRSPAAVNVIELDRPTEMGELMMMGLRLTREGISETEFLRRFERPLEAVYPHQIQRLTRLGLLEWASIGSDGERCLRLTKPGRLLGNMVFREFI